MPATKQLFDRRFSKAEKRRKVIEDRLDECYKYALPGRARFNETPGSARIDQDLYDETAVVSLEDFASVIHSRLTPDFTEWVSLSADASIEESDRSAVNRDLEQITKYIFQEINGSNFTQEAQETYLDLGCSVGAMVVEWRDGGLRHSSVPATQSYFEPGAFDDIGGMFRKRDDVRLEHLEAMYPDAKLTVEMERQIAAEADRTVTVVDGMWRTYSMKGSQARRAVMVDGVTGGGHLIVTEELQNALDLPFTAFRFSKAAGEVYGRGPIMKVMSGIKTTNLVIELMLQNAAMSLAGMYHIENDGEINMDTLTIEPGAVIPRAPGSRGLEPIQHSGQHFNVAGIVLDDQRRNIRNGTYTDALGDPNRSPMKATEALLRTQEMAARTSANIGRVTGEFIRPYIRRVAYLLSEAGRIELPIPLDNILITPEGPLARAVRQQNMQSFVQLHELLASIIGPQLALGAYRPVELVEWLRSSLGSPQEIMADPDELRERMSAALGAASEAAQMQAAGGAPQ